jgi:hypothetical protein
MFDPQTAAQEKRPAEVSAGQEGKPVVPRRFLAIGIAVLVILLAALVVLTVLAFRNPLHTQTLRDIAIIALALESGLIGLAILVLIVQVARLTNMLEFEIKPILGNTNDALKTVRGTAGFLSERIVAPVIKASGYASGVARLAGTLGSLVRTGRTEAPAGAGQGMRRKKRRKNQDERQDK